MCDDEDVLIYDPSMSPQFEYECICTPEPEGAQLHGETCVFTNMMRAEAYVRDHDLDGPLLIATIPDAAVDDWKTQERMHPATGRIGISYVENPTAFGVVAHTLLHRNRKGRLTGVLYFYPEAVPMLRQPPGMVHMWVAPHRRDRGVGKALALEAIRRWPEIDLTAQKYTSGGLAMARIALEAGHGAG